MPLKRKKEKKRKGSIPVLSLAEELEHEPKTLRISKSNVNFEEADKKVFSVHFQAAFLRMNCHCFQMTHTQGRAHTLAHNLSL